MKDKIKYLFGAFLFALLIGISFVSASHYALGGYDNYRDYYGYYDSYNYDHAFANSRPNYYSQPNLISLSSKDRYDDGYFYRSKDSSFRSFNSYYPGYSGVNNYEREYVIDRYYPYHSYEITNDYRESRSPSSYSRHEENNFRKLSRPETYVVLWTYR